MSCFYGQHKTNFEQGEHRYYISSIAIFKDENGKPSMTISVNTVAPDGVSVGSVGVLGVFNEHSIWETETALKHKRTLIQMVW